MLTVDDITGLQERIGPGATTGHEQKTAALHELQAQLEAATELSPDVSDLLTPLLQSATKSSNAAVSLAALSCLASYFPLLLPTLASSSAALSSSTAADSTPTYSVAHSHALRAVLVALLPTERLGDSKERVRECARGALVAAARTSLRLGITVGTGKENAWDYLSRGVVEGGFWSKNAKAREQALLYVLAIRAPTAEHPQPPLRPFTPLLLSLLSDADPAVRALALSTTISIFSSPTVSAPARADLKKEMVKLDVGGKVQDTILAAVLGSHPDTHSTEDTPPLSTAGLSRALSASTSTLTAEAPLPSAAFPSAASQPLSNGTPAEPQAIYLASAADLSEEFEKMKPGFEGKETEFNWIVRDKNIGRVRGMIQGGVAGGELRDAFLDAFKGILEGVLKTASSLRTTVATTALLLMTELSLAFTTLLSSHSLLQPLLSHALSMSGQTKKLVATASQSAATTLITHSTYHLYLVQLLAQGLSDKIPLARTFHSAHFLTFLATHGVNAKAAIEHSGGLEIMESCLHKGLGDSAGVVKENMRKAFWVMRSIWETRMDKLLGTLDLSIKKGLDKVDPRLAGAGGAKTAVVAKKGGRLSVKEMMAEKARAAKLENGNGVAQIVIPDTVDTTINSSSPSRTVTPRSALSPASKPVRASPAARIQRSASASSISNTILSSSSAASNDTATRRRRISNAPESQLTPTKSSRTPGKSSLATTPTRASPRSRIIPVEEPIVEAALRSQAAQAEQTAERLLELTQENSLEEDYTALEAESPLITGSDYSPLIGSSLPSDSEDRDVVEVDRTKSLRALPPSTPGTLGALRRSDNMFLDSPDARNGAHNGGGGKGNWWMNKMKGLGLSVIIPVVPDSPERLQEIDNFISRLESGDIDAAGLRQLMGVSESKPMSDEGDDDDENAVSASGAFWKNRFPTVFASLGNLLRESKTEETKDVGLVLLKNLVDHQAAGFFGNEAKVLLLLLKLREDTSRSSTAAIESISDSLALHLDPVCGLGSLRQSLIQYLARAEGLITANSHAMGVRLMGKFFERLPREVVEDEIPKLAVLIKNALNHSVPEIRRAAITTLVSAHRQLQDEPKLLSMIGDLAPDQKNLLAYYFAR